MTSAERFVVDTNVLISAVLVSTGSPARFFDSLQHATATLVFSPPTLAELHTRLMRRKFERYVSIATRERFLAQVDAVSEHVLIVNTPMGCRDPQDDKFLETAKLADVRCLITGDEDFLVMHPFQGIPILTPGEALEQYFGG
jgi:uncharacterized protein